MLPHETRPWHFFIPMIMVIIAGVFMRFDTWEYIGWLILLVAAATVYFLLYTTKKDKELEAQQEEHSHLATLTSMDAAKTKVVTAIQKAELGGYMSQTFNTLEILPAQLKEFAYGVLVGGRKMTIREWTPRNKGKTFSDGEWRRLIAFMKQPDWDDKHIKFLVPINPNHENEGFELTEAGRQWLQAVLDNSVLTPR